MQLIIFACVLLFGFAAALPAAQITNGSLGISPAIIDGNFPTKINYREVAIVSDADYPPAKLCSGVLIRTEWVLTSAYCVKDKPALRVLLGTSAINQIGIGLEGKMVDRTFSYPYYNSLYMIHDIALLYVKGATNADFVTVAALPTLTGVPNEYVGKSAVVSGYGLEGNNAAVPAFYLRYKDVQIIDNTYCTQEGHSMNAYKLCSAGRAVCEGDQGGPLTIGNTVVGIASAALKALNCEGQVSATYTRVNYYRQWIDQTIYSVCRC